VTLRRGTVLIAAEERPELNYYSNGDTLTRGGLVGSIPEWLLHGNLAATTIWLQVAELGRTRAATIGHHLPDQILVTTAQV